MTATQLAGRILAEASDRVELGPFTVCRIKSLCRLAIEQEEKGKPPEIRFTIATEPLNFDRFTCRDCGGPAGHDGVCRACKCARTGERQ